MPFSPRRTMPMHAAIGVLVLALGPMMLLMQRAPGAYDPRQPATWSNWSLAAQLTVSCLDMDHLADARRQAQAGIGGITLLGDRPRRDLGGRLAAARRAAPHGIAPFVMSDEEGGAVQRLRTAIYPLPSARTMGTWPTARIRRTAHHYGVRMRRLGVRMDLAPVVDLTVPGSYMTRLQRTFSANPHRVATIARAWRLGMHDAGVVTVLKHWPGHGSAANSHTGPAAAPPLRRLRTRDLVPFRIELHRGARVVMVGHLRSRGLTEPGRPASESPRALRYLRRTAGDEVVILTDALNMAAASTSLGITPAQAAVRALRAGADWALVCSNHPLKAVGTVRDAIASGQLPRAQAEASAERILRLKSENGLAPH